MEKLNFKKESVIEILRLIEKRMSEPLPQQKGTTITAFSVYFYTENYVTKGDVFFEKIGYLK